MTTALRAAISFVDEQRRAHPEERPRTLVEEAIRRFDLSLTDQQALWQLVRGPGRPTT